MMTMLSSAASTVARSLDSCALRSVMSRTTESTCGLPWYITGEPSTSMYTLEPSLRGTWLSVRKCRPAATSAR